MRTTTNINVFFTHEEVKEILTDHARQQDLKREYGTRVGVFDDRRMQVFDMSLIKNGEIRLNFVPTSQMSEVPAARPTIPVEEPSHCPPLPGNEIES